MFIQEIKDRSHHQNKGIFLLNNHIFIDFRFAQDAILHYRNLFQTFLRATKTKLERHSKRIQNFGNLRQS